MKNPRKYYILRMTGNVKSLEDFNLVIEENEKTKTKEIKYWKPNQ